MDEDQELPAPEALISRVVIGDTGHRQNPASKCLIPVIGTDAHADLYLYLHQIRTMVMPEVE